MKNYYFCFFPNKKKKAVTFSFDDGKLSDIKLAEDLNAYGAKCTFNLNYITLGRENYIDKSFVKELSKTHEIASHSMSHVFMERLPQRELLKEIYEDKELLENLIGLPVTGFAYPYGTYDERVKDVVKSAGFLYARTVKDTFDFGYPTDYIEWHPTCHQSKALPLIDKFLARNTPLDSMYIWGHSREFNDNPDGLKNILAALSKSNDIWYCTNTELYDYKKAINDLRISADGSHIYNPSAISVFAVEGGRYIEIKPGHNEIE